MPGYIEIDISFRALSEVSLWQYKGSALRGALGLKLKHQFCKNNCRLACRSPEKCIYGRIFEARNSDLNKPLFGMPVSKPVVFTSPDYHNTVFGKDELIHFKVFVFGREMNLFSGAILSALSAIDSIGMFRSQGQGKVELGGVATSTLQFPKVEFKSVLSIRFLSPAVLLKDSKLVVNPTLDLFAMNCARKYHNLLTFLYDANPEVDFSLIKEHSAVANDYKKIRVVELSKWSQKRGRKEGISGLVGDIEFQLPENEEYRDLMGKILSITSITGIGKRSSHGFGRFDLL